MLSFLHFCGGIRHLAWDAGYGFETASDLCFRLGRGGGERGADLGSLDRHSVRDVVKPDDPEGRCVLPSVAPRPGSAKEGVEHWWRERVTAVALISLTLWFVPSIIAHSGGDYGEFVEWLKTPLATCMMILLLIALFYHTALGLCS